jgi:hypothetical protein
MDTNAQEVQRRSLRLIADVQGTADSGFDSDFSDGMESVTSENYQFEQRGGRRLVAPVLCV